MLTQIQQVPISLMGDGSSTSFTLSLSDFYGDSSATAASIHSSDVPASLMLEDGTGNLTINLSSPLGIGVVANFVINLQYAVGTVEGMVPLQSVNSILTQVSIPNSIKVDGSATVQPVSGSVSISNFPSTQPVSVTTLPLPANSAKESGGNLDILSGTVLSGKVQINVTNSSLPVTGVFWQATQPVSVTLLPLPSGASTSALQTSGNLSLSSLDTKIPAPVSGRVPVDGSGVTQPVSFTAPQHVVVDSAPNTTISGSVTVSNFPATQPVSIASMPSTPVTGVFWPVTQPISGAISFVSPQHVVVDSVPNTDSSSTMYVNTEGRRTTYRGMIVNVTPILGLAQFAPFLTLVGSPTKTIRVTRIVLDWFCTTGTALPSTLRILRYSSLTGGTNATLNRGNLDTTDPLSTAFLQNWSGQATATTITDYLAAASVSWVTSGATVQNPIGHAEWTFGDRGGRQCVLRGNSQWLGLSLSALGTTPVVNGYFEWIEE